jgi:hypothetical protein
MTEQDKNDAARLLALLVEATEHEETSEEATAELVADGVNVSAFLARIHEAVKLQKKEERLAWRVEARRNAEQFARTGDVTLKFATMTRQQLVEEARKYADQIHFKNFEEATDDDLRTQLADRARLEDLASKK